MVKVQTLFCKLCVIPSHSHVFNFNMCIFLENDVNYECALLCTCPSILQKSLTQHVYFFLENDVNYECTLYAHA
jgi:hypothetical protein